MVRRHVIFRKSETRLPRWLDDLIFRRLGAIYNPFPEESEHNLYSREPRVKEYLGTYFPRSYGEAFCIAENLLQNEIFRSSLGSEISILGIGCGTGGEIVGLLSAMEKYLPGDASFNVYASDGNSTALEKAVSEFAGRYGRKVSVRETCHKAGSEAGLLYMARRVRNVRFDFILCCKMCGELWSRGVSDSPYLSAAEKFSGLLKPDGVMLILDLANRPDGCAEYLPVEMNAELNDFVRSHEEFSTLLPKPCGAYPECRCSCYMQQRFFISHSEMKDDLSKVCYRIICRRELRNRLVTDSVLEERQVIYPWADGGFEICRYSGGRRKSEAFNLNS